MHVVGHKSVVGHLGHAHGVGGAKLREGVGAVARGEDVLRGGAGVVDDLFC